METLQRTANRGSISTGYDIDNSLKLESDNSEYLDNRHHSAGNRRTWTLSFWIKRTELGTTQKPYDAGNIASIGFLSTDKIQIENSDLYLVTDRVFRDTSAWYHIVQLNDSTQSTASNRAKLWINGVQETSFSSETYMAQNQEGNMNSATSVSIGGGGGAHVNGYMAELFFVDGQALAPTDFGEFDSDSGIWIPKEYEGTLSGTSLKLDFSNSSALWEDSSGLSGNGTAMSGVNITSADQATDTPTNNFAIGNTLTGTGGFFVITEGATKAVLSTAGPGNNIGGVSLMSTLLVSSGKWYFEAQNTNSGDAYLFLGVADTASKGYTDGYVLGGQSGTLPSIAWWGGGAYDGSAKVYTNNVATGSSVNWETEVVGVALDLDNGKIYFHKSGTYINSGDPANGTDNGGQYDLPTAVDDQWILGVSAYNLATWHINFGGFTTMSISSAESDANGYGTFEYAPPSGYYALCTKNLAEYG